jgi:hypothetical protein
MPRDPLSALSEEERELYDSVGMFGGDYTGLRLVIDRLCSLLVSSPAEPEIEAIRRYPKSWREARTSVVHKSLAAQTVETLLLAYDRSRKERDEAKDAERELLFTERNLLSRLERAVSAQDKGDALRAALDDEETARTIVRQYSPCGIVGPAEVIAAYRAKLREAEK